MNKLSIIILAAGQGKRMKSSTPKVLHLLSGQPLLDYVIKTSKKLNAEKIVIVIGNKANQVRDKFIDAGVEFALQEKQLGTAHAVSMAEENLLSFKGDILVLSGDVPLINSDTLQKLIKIHQEDSSEVTILTTKLENPTGYGRIIRDSYRKVISIVEEKDASPEEKNINEINSGIYCFKKSFLFKSIKKIDSNNKQGEFYITDLIEMAFEANLNVSAIETKDSIEVMGINNVNQLRVMEKIVGKTPH